MKKIIIYSILSAVFLLGYNFAEAIETKAENYTVVKTSEQDNTANIYETSQIKIIKKDNKYGVFDKKENKYFVKPILDSISKFSKNNDFEYKVKSHDMLGYMNLVTRDAFLSYFDDIAIIDSKYLKVKKGDKYGITDKKGRVIVPAEYQRVSVTKYDDVEYLIGKKDNIYNAYYNNGTLVTNDDLYQIDKTTLGTSVVKDLNPLLQEYRASVRKANAETTYIYDNSDSNFIEKKTDKDAKSSIIAVNYVADDLKPELKVETPEVPENVKKLSVKHEEHAYKLDSLRNNDAIEVMTLNHKSYYIINKNGKLGLQSTHGKELIPAKYISLTVKQLNPKNPKDIVAAVGPKEVKLYDVNGDIIAKKYRNKVDVYTSMRKYEYILEGGIYNIEFNDRKVGQIKVLEDGNYHYTKTGFNMSNMKSANEIFLTLLSADKQ